MGIAIERSEDTHQRLLELASQQHSTPEQVIRQFLTDCENQLYRQANQRMLAEGVLASLPAEQPIEDEDFEPEVISGKPLFEVIIEERH